MMMILLSLNPIASEDRLTNPMLVFSLLLDGEPFVAFACFEEEKNQKILEEVLPPKNPL